MFSCDDTASLLAVMDDATPEGIDAIYVMAEAEDGAAATMEFVAQLGVLRSCKFLVPGWEQNRLGYCGCTAYADMLYAAGCDTVVAVPPVDLVNQNARTEALALCAYCKKEGIGRVLVIAPTVHQPRAFLTILAARQEIRCPTWFYNGVARQVMTSRVMTHNQGVTRGTMQELMALEMGRIDTYSRSGHVLLGAPVFQYLIDRDAH